MQSIADTGPIGATNGFGRAHHARHLVTIDQPDCYCVNRSGGLLHACRREVGDLVGGGVARRLDTNERGGRVTGCGRRRSARCGGGAAQLDTANGRDAERPG
jgi:hypothetical protein